MWKKRQSCGVPVNHQSSACNLSTTQLDLQRPVSCVFLCDYVCGCEGLKGSAATEACVDIWFEKSAPHHLRLQLSALTSTPQCFLAFWQGESVWGRPLMFDFLCISRSQNYPKGDLKAPASLKCSFEVIWKCVFQMLSEIWGISWVPRPHSNFKVPHWRL